MTGKFLHYTYR